MDRFFPTICVVLTILLVMAVVPAAYAGSDLNATIDISFPVAGSTTYSDNYLANRDDGARRLAKVGGRDHVDVKLRELLDRLDHALVDVVCQMHVDLALRAARALGRSY